MAKLQQLTLTPSLWPECHIPSYRISLIQGWTVYMNGERTYHSLCFRYICGLAKWLQFQKAQHKPGLTNTGEWGKCCIYIKGFCPEVFLVWWHCYADSLPYQTSTWGASKQTYVQQSHETHHLAPWLTLALHLNFWVSPKPRENEEGKKLQCSNP